MAAVIVKRYDSKRIPGQDFDDPEKKKQCIENSFEGIHSFMLWLTLSIGFAVSYMQRLSPSTWSDALVEEFEIDAAGFGSIAASYWYFYATLQIPIGIILDLFGRFVRVVSQVAASPYCYFKIHYQPTLFFLSLCFLN